MLDAAMTFDPFIYQYDSTPKSVHILDYHEAKKRYRMHRYEKLLKDLSSISHKLYERKYGYIKNRRRLMVYLNKAKMLAWREYYHETLRRHGRKEEKP